MMTKREEAARAVALCRLRKMKGEKLPAKRERELINQQWSAFLPEVDAVIACIREPDEKMRKVAKTAPIAYFNCDVTNKKELLKCLAKQDWKIDTIPSYQAILDAME